MSTYSSFLCLESGGYPPRTDSIPPERKRDFFEGVGVRNLSIVSKFLAFCFCNVFGFSLHQLCKTSSFCILRSKQDSDRLSFHSSVHVKTVVV